MTELIIVKHYIQEKNANRWVTIEKFEDQEITLNMFQESFVNERLKGERRHNKQYTKLGDFHTKTIVNRDENYRSVREFIFPE